LNRLMNNVSKAVKNWLDSAEYDMETAQHMLNTGRYIYTVFMCHLALEKVLKAKVESVMGKTPPRTHDLERLFQLADLPPDEPKNNIIAELSGLSIVTRYPEDFQQIKKAFTKEKTTVMFNNTNEVFQWIKKLMEL